MECRWVHQPPPHPLLDLMMNSCFGTRFYSSFPENLTMSSRQFVSHLFLLRHPESEVSWPQSDLNLGQIWWLAHFPRVIMLVLIWLGKVMSCLAHLAGGSIVIVFLFSLVKLSSMRRLHDLFYQLFLINPSCIQRLTLLEDHVNAISKHVCATPIINKSIWSTMLNSLYQLS